MLHLLKGIGTLLMVVKAAAVPSALFVLLKLDDLLLYCGNVLLPDVYISGIDSGLPSL
jgi:hypothetical protein